jgi:2-polyprenyl-6-methoxyphenol hydroxylase-like FAD-dependent oxidoreductase
VRVGIVGGSIADCTAAALLLRAGHDVMVFERSESDLVSRGAGIVSGTLVWQNMMTQGLFDSTVPGCRADYSRLVTREPETGQERWLGDIQMGFTLFNWAHLYESLRRNVPDELYRSDAAVERIEATSHGAILHLVHGGSADFDLVVCADGYRSLGRWFIDPGAAPIYRGMVLWRGLIPERDASVDALAGCDLLRPVYQGGHGLAGYIPGPGQSTERGERLLMWGYYLQVPQSALASVLVDDQERQQSNSVPFGKVHPEVRAALESRLAELLPSSLLELVQQSGHSSIQAIYSFVPRSYARDRVCLVGDAGAVFPPFAGGGVLRAVANATSLTDALADAPSVDHALRRWSEAQAQVAAEVIPDAEGIERHYVFDMPDLGTMPTAAANDWVSASYSGLAVTLPGVLPARPQSADPPPGPQD